MAAYLIVKIGKRMGVKIEKVTGGSPFQNALNIYADPVLSLTIWSSDLLREKINNPPSMAAIVIMPKKILLSGILSQKLAITPATLPPKDVERNQPPIINAVNRGGDNFETNDRPIGLRHISLIVNMPYVRTSQIDPV